MGLTTLQPSCAEYLEIWEPQLSGTLWACNGHVDGLLNLFIVIPLFRFLVALSTS